MMKFKLLFVLFLVCYLTACQNNNRQNDASLVAKNEVTESISEFLDLFYSDSIFQISRIVFPMESDDISENEMETHYNKMNWVILTNCYFNGNDSIAIIEGEVYKRRVLKSENYYEETVFIEDSGFFVIVKFKLINRKWYLVDYVESFN